MTAASTLKSCSDVPLVPGDRPALSRLCRLSLHRPSIHTTARGASAVAVLSWLLCGNAAADPQPAAESSPSTVTIEGRKQKEMIEHQIQAFVNSITISSFNESLPRWERPICPLIAGLPRDEGEFFLARLSQVARDAGARLASPQCSRPNFLVVVTAEPEVLLRKWRHKDARLFVTDRGGIEPFISTPRPIRVWHNTGRFCQGGETYLNWQSNMVTLVTGVCRGVTGGTHLQWNDGLGTRQIGSAIVVVDAKRIDGLNIGQLSDYIAMTGLAPVRLKPSSGDAPTILQLFADTGAAKPASLSSWDQSFLSALYHTDPRSVMQINEITFKLYRDLVP